MGERAFLGNFWRSPKGQQTADVTLRQENPDFRDEVKIPTKAAVANFTRELP
jgi:hypothetical protein